MRKMKELSFHELCNDYKNFALSLLIKERHLMSVVVITYQDGSKGIFPRTPRAQFEYEIRQLVKETHATELFAISYATAAIEPKTGFENEVARTTFECVHIEAGDNKGERYSFCQKFHRENDAIILDDPLDLSKGLGESLLLDGLFETVQ